MDDQTQSSPTQDSGGMGCWWMVAIAIIVVFALLVGYLVLV